MMEVYRPSPQLNMELSEELKHFAELAEHIQNHYKFADRQKQQIERMIADYMHILELEDLPAQSQLRLVREVKKLRKERRVWRDILDIEEAFSRFLEKKVAKEFFGQLAPVIERTAHQEAYVKDRSYKPKELTDEQIQAIHSHSGGLTALREFLQEK